MNILFVCLLTIGHVLGESNYCSITRDHTMCRYRGVGHTCKNPKERGLSKLEKKEVLDYHNRLRSQVARGLTKQPPSSNMKELEWDEELAKVAQRHADQCKFRHDCSNCRRVERFKVGQNIYQSFSTNSERTDWRKAIDSWFNEIQSFSPRSVSSYSFSTKTGHYSQLVWADTSKIGCGVIQHKDGRFTARLYVCNYGEAGNILRRPVYKIGKACSSCPCGTSCSTSYPGLCSADSSSNMLLCMINRPLNIMADMSMHTAHDVMHTFHDTAGNVGDMASDTVNGVGNVAINSVDQVNKFVNDGFRPVTSLFNTGFNFISSNFTPQKNVFWGKK